MLVNCIVLRHFENLWLYVIFKAASSLKKQHWTRNNEKLFVDISCFLKSRSLSNIFPRFSTFLLPITKVSTCCLFLWGSKYQRKLGNTQENMLRIYGDKYSFNVYLLLDANVILISKQNLNIFLIMLLYNMDKIYDLYKI